MISYGVLLCDDAAALYFIQNLAVAGFPQPSPTHSSPLVNRGQVNVPAGGANKLDLLPSKIFVLQNFLFHFWRQMRKGDIPSKLSFMTINCPDFYF